MSSEALAYALASEEVFPIEWRRYEIPDLFPGLPRASKLGEQALKCTLEFTGAYTPGEIIEDSDARSPEACELANIKYFTFYELHNDIYRRLTDDGSKRHYAIHVAEARAAVGAANEKLGCNHESNLLFIADFTEVLADKYQLERNNIFADIPERLDVALSS